MISSEYEKIKFNSKEIKVHSKASERYVDVFFEFDNRKNWTGWVPIEYRRAGLYLETNKEINNHLNET